MSFRMKWLGNHNNTYAVNMHGVELRVKYLPSSKMYGVYKDGVLRFKLADRGKAKVQAKRWFGWDRPADTVRCTTCNGTGQVRRGTQ